MVPRDTVHEASSYRPAAVGHTRDALSYRPNTSRFMAQVERPACQARY